MNQENILSDMEYEKLINRLEFFDTMRNNLLTFSFTAVLTVLGIAIGDNDMEISYWICLVPYFLIIPFAARISYYRLASAHISSFLRTFTPHKMIFENGANRKVFEKHGKMYYPIAWLVNHEMFVLSIATEVVFIFKMYAQKETLTYMDLISCIIPTVLSLIVLLMSNSTFNYGKLTKNYGERWKGYLEEYNKPSKNK